MGERMYRVLRKGGYLVSFGGTRTYHRMVSGIEDAGFFIKDSSHGITELISKKHQHIKTSRQKRW